MSETFIDTEGNPATSALDVAKAFMAKNNMTPIIADPPEPEPKAPNRDTTTELHIDYGIERAIIAGAEVMRPPPFSSTSSLSLASEISRLNNSIVQLTKCVSDLSRQLR